MLDESFEAKPKTAIQKKENASAKIPRVVLFIDKKEPPPIRESKRCASETFEKKGGNR
jgi:hypothetical protein